ncbi:MAG TPA: helicase-related protein [Accumulibacter sp.]|uniref:helicase-related protein n=1 Tax=Accumulibacter sp. TaxID=2053492 RepID=UPI002BBC08C7|nr:helicase-related protein [Accumulibacter sp.]HMV04730.1 helicase-related protein [Accumulibacter sp.]
MEAGEIRKLRERLGLTQAAMAAQLGVNFVTLSRWELARSRPSALALDRLRELEHAQCAAIAAGVDAADRAARKLDFLGDANQVVTLVEGERLACGHLFNPAFASEISQVDPLPHQRLAVYERMLPQPRLRFGLFDDAGAGKTIMTGLYIRESLSRRTLRRVLVVVPAGLVGNWWRELRTLFQLPFRIVTGSDARQGNPFSGADSDLLIVSLDSLRGRSLFGCLRDARALPYDLVVFDEAHKLSANRDADGSFRPTDRYRLAEALAGVRDIPDEWRLGWSAHHLLLLTATPHMGKPFPYYCLWRLLEPELFSTEAAFAAFPPDERKTYFVRRVKEEMVDLHGAPLYPLRVCDTHSYELSQGPLSEHELYVRTTAYIRHFYDQARLFSRSAARFAMTIFQRRLASSTWALLCSLRKRLEKLDTLIDDIRCGRIGEEHLREQQQRLDRQVRDTLLEATADEEGSEGGAEAHEKDEALALSAFVASSLAELLVEREAVQELVSLAEAVHARGLERKFDKLSELLRSAQFAHEKVIIYSEHRDTLDFLVRRFAAMGHVGQVAQVHGGLDFAARDAQVELFRRPHAGRAGAEGPGARFFVATDAAAEGINLQFCWVLVNYDLPWNPARLEQRMGRIHRYGQKRDRVAIINLVAGKTREGRVVRTLLKKMEEIRRELGSDKVFDVIGRVFEGFSLSEYIRCAIVSEADADRAALDLAGQLTVEQMRAIAAREQAIFGRGGEVAQELPRLQEALHIEEMRHLLPGYVRRYLEHAAPIIDLDLVGDLDGSFSLRARKKGALDSIVPLLENYPESVRARLTVHRPVDRRDAVFLHPGEAVFDRLSALAAARCRASGQRGAVFVDVSAAAPYLLHVVRGNVVRKADEAFAALQREEVLEQRLLAVKQYADTRIEETSLEQMLLLRAAPQVDAASIDLLAQADTCQRLAEAFVAGTLLDRMSANRRRQAMDHLCHSEDYLRRAHDYQESELASQRQRCTQRAREGDSRALPELERIKAQQRRLNERRDHALAQARRAVELIEPGPVEHIATALVQPSADPRDVMARDLEVERIAMQITMAFEVAAGAEVRDVSTPERARQAGLTDHPGFDVFSRRADGERAIEVKGRVDTGEVELSENEWAKAINLRHRYWLYTVFDCGSASPRLLRVQDPFGKLIARGKASFVVSARAILEAAETLR